VTSPDRPGDRATFLQTINLWRPSRLMNHEAWLSNFTADEVPVARALLEALVYYNDDFTDALLVAAVRGLAPHITDGAPSYTHARALWQHFLLSVTVTYVVRPEHQDNHTKSGYLYMRKARQQLGVTAEQVKPVPLLLRDPALAYDRPVLIIDDFAGTGEEFISGYNHEHAGCPGPTSLATLRLAGAPIFFCPSVATTRAVAAIEELGESRPIVNAAHVLAPELSLTHAHCPLLPKAVSGNDVMQVAQAAAERADMPHPLGYGDLALGLGFAHGTPDATLTAYHHDAGGWKPLIRRN
jgi:hypothetical protein